MEQTQEIILTLAIEREGDNLYASQCLELGTASCGSTFEEALANIRKAILVHLDALGEIGERERFFRERNIQILPRPISDDIAAAGETDRLEVSIRVPVYA